MGRVGRFGKSVLVFIIALLVVDLLYGYTLGPPTSKYVQLGLHVLAVVLVFPLAAILNAWAAASLRMMPVESEMKSREKSRPSLISMPRVLM